MKSPIRTRSFLISDYDAVVQLWQTADGVEIAEGDSRANIARYLKRNPNLSRVAEADGRVIGAVLCGHDGRRGIIYHLAVAVDYRGVGLGRKLLKECLAGLKAEGLTRVLLLVGKNNEAGQAFWLSQGFEVIAEALPLGRDLI